MKNLSSLLLLLFCISCHEIEYDGETRYVIETMVKDTGGNPLKNKEVEVTVSDLEDSDYISEGRTDANGKLTLVFPAAKGDSVKYSINFKGDDFHQQKEYLNIINDDFVDYKFSLNDVVLYSHDEITTLTIDIEEINPNIRFDGFTIDATSPEYHVDFGNQFPEGVYNHDVTVGILKNQTATLHYTLTDLSTMVTTDYTVEIPVANDPVTYVISY